MDNFCLIDPKYPVKIRRTPSPALGPEAGGGVVRPRDFETRAVHSAFCNDIGTARVKVTTARRIDRARNISGEDDALVFAVGIRNWNRRQ